MKNVNLPLIFETIKKIEEIYPVDDIRLHDGTKLWNLIRILLYFYPQKNGDGGKKINPKTIFNFVKENLSPIKIPHDIEICGFSGTESRKYRNGKFYDIYMDPLYDIIGNKFCVFEWPTPAGYRRDYKQKIYSKKYVEMHIPMFSKTFFGIGMNKLGIRNFSIKSRNILQNSVEFFSKKLEVNRHDLIREINDAIAVFFNLKKFFIHLLQKISPKAVLMRCGYGRFHMALSQACKELGIPSIELQHGIITKYHAGYVKSTESENRDCVPEYLLTYGKIFENIVKEGTLFEPKKVISVGFPYIEEIKSSPPVLSGKLEKFVTDFNATIFITSQWIVAEKVKKFAIDVAAKLKKDIGIIFKPHPRDWREYKEMKKYSNIFLSSKYDDTYEIFKIINIHSTVYSTSGLEALVFGKPNIFIDVGETTVQDIIEIVDEKASFLVSSSKQFIEKLEHILADYNRISKNALEASKKFFKPNAKKNIENFFDSIGIL